MSSFNTEKSFIHTSFNPCQRPNHLILTVEIIVNEEWIGVKSTYVTCGCDQLTPHLIKEAQKMICTNCSNEIKPVPYGC